MTSIRRLLVAIVIALNMQMGSRVEAESVKAPAVMPFSLPEGTYPGKVPSYFKYQILFSYGEKEGGASGGNAKSVPDTRLDRLTYTRTEQYWNAVAVARSGSSLETWYDGMVIYMIRDGIDEIASSGTDPMSLDALPAEANFYGLDFPDMNWLSRQTYVGVQVIDSVKCLVFRQGGDGATVWLNSQTRHPVRWVKGMQTRTFKYLPAPENPLNLPTKIAELSKMLKQGFENNRRLPPPLH